jgi:hypothetical protein
MLPSTAKPGTPITACSALVERYFDVIEALDRALLRLEAERNTELAGQLRADHERGARLVTELILELGGEPPTRGDLGRIAADVKVAIGEIAGDRGLLGALKSNESSLCRALERAETALESASLRARITEELGVARAHVAKLDERLEELRDSAHVLS